MSVLEDGLKGLAGLQSTKPYLFIAVAVVLTVVMLAGLPNLQLEGDIYKQMPNTPEMELSDKISYKFGGSDTILIAIQIDDEFDAANPVTDIRDPRVLEYLIDLSDSFREETVVSDVISPALIFEQTGVPDTLEGVKAILDAFPQANEFFSDDKTVTLMYLTAEVGSDTEKINKVTARFEDIISKVSKPAGIKSSVTGSPQIISTLVELLESDAFTTLLAAIIAVTILLLILARSQGILIVIPLVLGVIWMFGTMAWLNIPLSFATAGVGALIIGLGVEYGVFYIRRFEEELHHDHSPKEALQIAVPQVGSAIVGSSFTTISGFLALTLASMPMMQNLGLTLALGIFYSLIAALVINPAIALCIERGCLMKIHINGKDKEC